MVKNMDNKHKLWVKAEAELTKVIDQIHSIRKQQDKLEKEKPLIIDMLGELRHFPSGKKATPSEIKRMKDIEKEISRLKKSEDKLQDKKDDIMKVMRKLSR